MQNPTERRRDASYNEFREKELARERAMIEAYDTFVKRSITKTIILALVVIGVTVILSLQP